MRNFKYNPGRSTRMRGVLIAIILVLLLSSSLSACSVGRASQQAAPLSLSALEAQYGLRVSLIAVTAAGGLVDVRLKVVDAEKARQLLKDAASYPALVVSGSDAVLTAPEESRTQELKLENGGLIMLLFPNTGNAVKPGANIAVLFGDIRLEPVVAK
jgi:ABC-type Na+ efflux pump permease subunit